MFSKRCISLDLPIKTPHPFCVLPNVPSHDLVVRNEFNASFTYYEGGYQRAGEGREGTIYMYVYLFVCHICAAQ